MKSFARHNNVPTFFTVVLISLLLFFLSMQESIFDGHCYVFLFLLVNVLDPELIL